MKKINQIIKYYKKQALISVGFVVFIFLVIGGSQVARAEWQEPNLPPPQEQMYAPITVGPENQTREGLLELNPFYSPTVDYSLIFDPRKPLDVRGVGALFGTNYLYNDFLTVDTDTLYVDSVNEWVSIGSTDVQAGIDEYGDPWIASATDAYQFRKKINFNTITMDELAENVPVMIKADITMGVGFWGNISDQANGNDIAFSDSQGNHLTHHFEIFNWDNRNMIAWVNVPTINIPTDYIYIYYGNSNPDPAYYDASNEAATYDDDFLMVQHMDDEGTGIVGSKSGYIGTKVGGTAQADGQIGYAQQFDGSGDYIDLGDILSPGSYDWTVEVWFNSSNESGLPNESIIYNKEYIWEAATGGGRFRFAWMPSWSWLGGDLFVVNENEWHYSVVVYDHSARRSYKNGLLYYAGGRTGDMSSNNEDLYIGARSLGDPDPEDAQCFFSGLIDEMRVSKTARSKDWVRASYLSGADQLVSSWGVVELAEGTSSIVSTKLWVANGGVQVGSQTVPVNGRSVSAYGADVLASGIYGVGLYGEAQGSGSAGIYGLSHDPWITGTDESGWAVRGESANNVGVKGESVYGQGIFAVNDDTDNAAVYGQNTSTGWAGYFDGPLGSGSDIISNRFTPSALGKSLMSFTSGQEIGEFSLGGGNQNAIYMAFDGTYIWVAGENRSPDNFYQIRASDGQLMNSWLIGTDLSFADVLYDGQYIWLAEDSLGNVIRFNPEDYTYQSVSGLSSTPKYDIEVSSINGQTYIWALDRNNSQLYKINASTLAIDETVDLNYNPYWLSNPMGMEFDGTYIWIAFSGNGIGRISAESPVGTMEFVETATAFDCQPHGVYYDGVNIWCLHGQNDDPGQILRIWPNNFYTTADPSYDPRYPMESFGPSIDHQKRAAFDGTYLWTISLDVPYTIYKYQISDPTQYETISVDYQPHDIIFDGTYIWVTESGNPPSLHQYYSGTGFGHTDLNAVVNMDPNDAQFGNINITGEAVIDTNITVGGDLDVLSNQWGDSYQTADADEDCPDGYFMSGLELLNGDILSLICHEL